MQIGSATPAPAPATSNPGGWQFASAAKPDATRQAFDDYEKLTPAQKMRQTILASLGLTEDQLKAMAPEERAKVEEKIREIMRKKVEEGAEKKTGQIIALKA